VKGSQKNIFNDFLTGLKSGDYVVHADHGIARFLGLDKKTVDDWEKGYKGEFKKVETDVGDILNKRGWGNLTGLEQFLGDLTGTGFEFYGS